MLISLRGKFNYTNSSRYSNLNEKTYRRQFAKKHNFIEFNRIGNAIAIPKTAVKIAAMDCSFNDKAGKKTYGLGQFWNGKQGKAEQGLEISTLALVDVDYNTAYHVSTRQTPAALEEGKTRADFYALHFQKDCYALPDDVRYVVTDAYYSKQVITQAILASGFHQIGKLRCDANLRYLYTGEQKPKGRPKQYDGKMVIGEVDRLEFVGEINGAKLYTAVVLCVNLQRNIRIVYAVEKTESRSSYALLFSTDTELEAKLIVQYYQARFQIEFLFRDAKQFTGLGDCQARSKEALHNHFNASFTALNLMKWLDREISPERKTISIGNWKLRFFNRLFIERIFSNSGFDLSLFKSTPAYEELCNFGVVAC